MIFFLPEILKLMSTFPFKRPMNCGLSGGIHWYTRPEDPLKNHFITSPLSGATELTLYSQSRITDSTPTSTSDGTSILFMFTATHSVGKCVLSISATNIIYCYLKSVLWMDFLHTLSTYVSTQAQRGLGT